MPVIKAASRHHQGSPARAGAPGATTGSRRQPFRRREHDCPEPHSGRRRVQHTRPAAVNDGPVDEFELRVGSSADLDAVMTLLDAAVEWLAGVGRGGQWGQEPWSKQPKQVAYTRSKIEQGELVLAERGAQVVGALVLSTAAPPYVPPAAEPESYVRLLVAGRERASRGVGARLLNEAARRAAAKGVLRERVDCWAGGDGRLVRYYVASGFTPAAQFDYHGWPGQVLERPVPHGSASKPQPVAPNRVRTAAVPD